ncbi:hypothetical protein M139_0212 [Bacteroides fragilis str. S23L24]|nr:hypothetical protein M139_0212 [Bacteroides fragilis str. S23L24]
MELGNIGGATRLGAKAEDAPEKHPTDYCNIVHNFPFL